MGIRNIRPPLRAIGTLGEHSSEHALDLREAHLELRERLSPKVTAQRIVLAHEPTVPQRGPIGQALSTVRFRVQLNVCFWRTVADCAPGFTCSADHLDPLGSGEEVRSIRR